MTSVLTDFCLPWVIGGVTLAIMLFAPIIILSYLSKKVDGAKYAGSHTLITGGSQGIGLELAKQCAERGANVTILARNQNKLSKAKEEIDKCRKYPDSQRVQAISCDLASSYEEVEGAIRKAEEFFGQEVGILINSAGFSTNKYFEEFTIAEFQMLMNVNYFGALYAIKAVLNNMKICKSGSIIFLSSQGAQVGFIGMTAYSPAKYALKGLAECLRSELLPFNINIGVVYPPDTDTPGYATENVDKAIECREISEMAGLVMPDYVAKEILSQTERGIYSISIGLDGFMLETVTCGMIPCEGVFKSFVQVYVIGIFRMVGMFYATIFQGIVMKHKDQRKLFK